MLPIIDNLYKKIRAINKGINFQKKFIAISFLKEISGKNEIQWL